MKMAPPRIKFESGDVNVKTQYNEELNMLVYWYPDGIIRIYYDTGVEETYYPKPKLSDIIARTKRGENGEYYRIHKDGSVENGFGGEYYYWGPEEDVEWNMTTIMDVPQCDYGCCGHSDDEDYEEYLWRYRDY
jgi:hypothetical protein